MESYESLGRKGEREGGRRRKENGSGVKAEKDKGLRARTVSIFR